MQLRHETFFCYSFLSVLERHAIILSRDSHTQDLTRQYLEGGWPSTTVLSPSNQRLFGFSGPRPPSNIVHNIENAASHLRRHPEVRHAQTPVPQPKLLCAHSSWERATRSGWDFQSFPKKRTAKPGTNTSEFVARFRTKPETRFRTRFYSWRSQPDERSALPLKSDPRILLRSC